MNHTDLSGDFDKQDEAPQRRWEQQIKEWSESLGVSPDELLRVLGMGRQIRWELAPERAL
jgi:hypothetical protein